MIKKRLIVKDCKLFEFTGLVEIFWVSNYKVNDRMILNI